MKKIITLLFSLGIVAVSFAQYDGSYGYRTDNDAYNRGDHYYKETFDPARSRDFQIQKIDEEFQNRINAIINDPYMRHFEKRDAIRNARIERDRQIEFVNDRFRNHWYNRPGNW